MSVVIIGGNECMERRYIDLCKSYSCKAKVYTKMKNESITGFCGKCATRTDADAVQTAPAVPNGHAFLFQLNKGIG